MNKIYTRFFFSLLISLFLFSCEEPPQSKTLNTEVLIIGGGASGITAGIQAARSGADVVLVEPTPWLGGMLTAAGVSAIDGNHNMPSGLWGEFRSKLYDHYGGPTEVETGWVSNTLFEPSVGNKIWNELADEEAFLQRIHGFHVISIQREGYQVMGATFLNEAGDSLKVTASVTIDATELGDALALAGASYKTGMDTESDPHNPNIQDLTYVAVLKDFGQGKDMTIPEPKGYDPSEFDCLCDKVCEDSSRNVPNCFTMLTYGRLPNNKFMLNWPNNGNDYYLNPIEMSFEERKEAYKKAKKRSLDFVHFIQKELGFPHLGLADDEFPTKDRLPFIPYHRESRRVDGQVQLKVADLLDPYADPKRPLYQHAIAVGDYPLDLHHKKNPEVKKKEFPPIPSFSIPYGCLVPKEVDGLLVAEKSISVTHDANGSTRLQPCVMEIGQAAGMAAALCVSDGRQPRQLPVRKLQQKLLDAHCWLMPYIDVNPAQPYFQAIQRVGLSGLMRGKGVPFKWANQTWFYPDSAVTKEMVLNAMPIETRPPAREALFRGELNRVQAVQLLHFLLKEQKYEFKESKAEEAPQDVAPNTAVAAFQAEGWLEGWIEGADFEPEKLLSRAELAFLIDKIYQPFGKAPTPLAGHPKK